MDEILNGTGPGVLTSSLPLQALSQVARMTRHGRTPGVRVCAAIPSVGGWVYAAG